MKRKISIFALAALATACNSGQGVTIDEQQAFGEAYDKSMEWATAVVEAKDYASCCEARATLEAYERAFREQIGGEEYLIFVEECNTILNQK